MKDSHKDSEICPKHSTNVCQAALSKEFEADEDDLFIFKAWDVFSNNDSDTKDILVQYDRKKEVLLFFSI